MKKSQRLRLATLTAQKERTAAEAAEFAWLQLLASVHTDASKDEDDTAPHGVLKAALLKFTAATTDKQQLASENANLKQRIAALEAGNLGAVTLGAVLTAASLKATDLAGKDAAAVLVAIQGTATSPSTTQLSAERDTARTQFKAIAVALGLALADNGSLLISAEALAKVGLKDDDEWKKLSAAQQLEKFVAAAAAHAISDRALATVKELGINADSLPGQQKQSGADAAGSAEEMRAEYQRLVAAGQHVEAGAYYAKNAEKMFGKN